jgi:hypothetical protein
MDAAMDDWAMKLVCSPSETLKQVFAPRRILFCTLKKKEKNNAVLIFPAHYFSIPLPW